MREASLRGWLFAVSCLAVSAACSDAGPCDPAPSAAVQLPEFVDAASGEFWPGQVHLEGVVVNGSRVTDLTSLTGDAAFNVVVQQGRLVCTTPCGFGSRRGRYAFTVRTVGYRPLQVNANVEIRGEAASCRTPRPVEVRPALHPWETPLEAITVPSERSSQDGRTGT